MEPGFSGWPRVLFVAFLFPAMMAFLWTQTAHDYASVHLILKEKWWIIAIMAVIIYAVARITASPFHFSDRVSYQGVLVAVPVALVIFGGIAAFKSGGVVWPTVVTVLLGTLFVGIAEELAYRGIILNELGKLYSVNKSVVISSVLFGVMHSVNAMKQPLLNTVTQVILTSIIGLAMAWVYVSSGGNLILVITLHWLYDGFLISPGASSIGVNKFGSLPALLLAVIALALTARNLRTYKGQTLGQLGLS